jgi:hypothetical protein
MLCLKNFCVDIRRVLHGRRDINFLCPILVCLEACPRISHSSEQLVLDSEKFQIFLGPNLKFDSDLLSFDVMTRSWPIYPSIFTYIASLVAKLPNAGRINPVKMALAIFLKLCVAQTSENSPATFSLPRTLKPRKPLPEK